MKDQVTLVLQEDCPEFNLIDNKVVDKTEAFSYSTCSTDNCYTLFKFVPIRQVIFQKFHH